MIPKCECSAELDWIRENETSTPYSVLNQCDLCRHADDLALIVRAAIFQPDMTDFAVTEVAMGSGDGLAWFSFYEEDKKPMPVERIEVPVDEYGLPILTDELRAALRKAVGEA